MSEFDRTNVGGMVCVCVDVWVYYYFLSCALPTAPSRSVRQAKVVGEEERREWYGVQSVIRVSRGLLSYRRLEGAPYDRVQ